MEHRMYYDARWRHHHVVRLLRKGYTIGEAINALKHFSWFRHRV